MLTPYFWFTSTAGRRRDEAMLGVNIWFGFTTVPHCSIVPMLMTEFGYYWVYAIENPLCLKKMRNTDNGTEGMVRGRWSYPFKESKPIRSSLHSNLDQQGWRAPDKADPRVATGGIGDAENPTLYHHRDKSFAGSVTQWSPLPPPGPTHAGRVKGWKVDVRVWVNTTYGCDYGREWSYRKTSITTRASPGPGQWARMGASKLITERIWGTWGCKKTTTRFYYEIVTLTSSISITHSKLQIS